MAGRFFYSVSVLFGTVSLVFLLFRGMGDPALMLAGQSGNTQTLNQIRKDLRLDEPVWKQYVYFLNDVSPICVHHKTTIQSKKLKGFFIGNHYRFGLKVPYLGKSYQTGKQAGEMLLEALPGTLLLAVTAISIALIPGIVFGVTAAVKRNSVLDRLSMFLATGGISAPSFFVGMLMIWIFAILLQSVTHLPVTGSWLDVDEETGRTFLNLNNLILPAITLGIRPMALIAQLTRSSMLDVMNQDYIRTAYAKGLSSKRILFKHALPNALNPVITAATGWFAELLAGAFFVEYIFGWQGIGSLTVQALNMLDFPVVTGAVLLSAFLFLLVQLGTDFLYRLYSPRLR